MEQQLNHRAWFEPPSKRLAMWRDFRKSLDSNDILAVCETVVDWWQSAPLVNIAIDPVDSSRWPTAWEMLHQGDFCEDSLALGMGYTIHYANPNVKNELVYITHTEEQFQRLCVQIDNKYLLNFRRGVISTLPIDDACIVNYRVNINKIT